MSGVLDKLKAIAALVGSAVTAALGILPPEQYKWLAVVSAVCTAIATYAVPNIPSAPSGKHAA